MMTRTAPTAAFPHPKGRLTLLWTIGLGLFLLNLSGDHVFYKTNNLKLAVLLVLITVLSLIVAAKWIKAERAQISPKLLIVILAPLLATLPGSLIHSENYSYLFEYEAISQASCILFMLCLISLVESETDILYLFKIASITVFFVCIVGLLEKLGLDPLNRLYLNPFERLWIGDVPGYSGLDSRIESTFGNINYFAGFLIQVLPVCLSFVLLHYSLAEKRHSISLWLSGSLVILVLLTLLMTGTRAALAGSAVSIVFFILTYTIFLKRIQFKKVAMVSVLAFAVAIAIMAAVNIDSVQRFAALTDISAWHSRIVPWETAIRSIYAEPIFGHGLGSSYQLFFEYVSPEGRLYTSERSYNHVHMEWLEVLQEGGIAGLLAYLVFWGYVFRQAYKLLINDEARFSSKMLVIGMFSGLIAFHIHGFFSVAPRMIVVRSIAYLLAALIIVLSLNEKKYHSKTKTSRFQPLLSLGIGLFLTLSWAWLIPYLNVNHQFSKSLAKTDYSSMKALALESENVYVIERTMDMALQKKDSDTLLALAGKLESIFPGYRNTRYYTALGAYLAGNNSHALKFASMAQTDDLYFQDNLILLTHLSLLYQDVDLFKRQLELAVRRYGCHSGVISPCNKTIVIQYGEMALPMQFFDESDRFSVYVNSSLFQSLSHLVSDNARTGAIQTQRWVVELFQAIGQSPYFIPKTLMTAPESVRNDLKEYLELDQKLERLTKPYIANTSSNVLGQLDQYWQEQRERNQLYQRLYQRQVQLEANLVEVLDLKGFNQKRDFIQELSKWVLTSTNPLR